MKGRGVERGCRVRTEGVSKEPWTQGLKVSGRGCRGHLGGAAGRGAGEAGHGTGMDGVRSLDDGGALGLPEHLAQVHHGYRARLDGRGQK